MRAAGCATSSSCTIVAASDVTNSFSKWLITSLRMALGPSDVRVIAASCAVSGEVERAQVLMARKSTRVGATARARKPHLLARLNVAHDGLFQPCAWRWAQRADRLVERHARGTPHAHTHNGERLREHPSDTRRGPHLTCACTRPSAKTTAQTGCSSSSSNPCCRNQRGDYAAQTASARIRIARACK